jgi:hypothetical protein
MKQGKMDHGQLSPDMVRKNYLLAFIGIRTQALVDDSQFLRSALFG